MSPTTSRSVKRVLLVDDHELVRAGMSDLIEAEPDLTVCGQAEDVPGAVELVRESSPHVAVVDLTLREGSGIDLIKQIRSIDPTVKVVVCSMHEDRLYAERALRAGATAYVNKNEPAERVLEAIRKVLAGRVFVDESIADRILLRVARGEKDGPRSAIETLSDRELEVLQLIGDGLTTRQIAEKLHLSVKTIDTYREHLKDKLGLDSANELVRYAVAWSLDPDAAAEMVDPDDN
jgi:DNA-binding NarL/FixJ family response regulator